MIKRQVKGVRTAKDIVLDINNLPDEEKLNESSYNSTSLSLELIEYGNINPSDLDSINYEIVEGIKPSDL